MPVTGSSLSIYLRIHAVVFMCSNAVVPINMIARVETIHPANDFVSIPIAIPPTIAAIGMTKDNSAVVKVSHFIQTAPQYRQVSKPSFTSPPQWPQIPS